MAARLRGALAVLVICASSLCPSCSGNSTFPSAAPLSEQEAEGRLGGTATLHCALGQTPFLVTWYRQRPGQAPEPVLIARASDLQLRYRAAPRLCPARGPPGAPVHLKIHNISRHDAGHYFCSGDIGGRPHFGNVTRLRLRARSETPVFVRVTEGQGATLPCEIKQRVSREELSVIWETPEERVFTLIKGTPRYGAGFENRVNFESVNRVAEGDLSLNISRIQVADRGVYSCYWTRDSHTLQFACSVVVAVAERGHLDGDSTSNLGSVSEAESFTPSNPTTPPAETGVGNGENHRIILAVAATAVATLVLALVFVVLMKKKMITKLWELKQQRGLTGVTVVSHEDSCAIKKNLLSNGHLPSSGPAELSSGHLTATKDTLLS